MAESQTPRVGVWRWTAGTDGPSRTEFDTSHANIEARVVIYLEGTRAARPAPGLGGRFYTVKGDTAVLNGQQFYDNGTAWISVGSNIEAAGIRPAAFGSVAETVTGLVGQTGNLTEWRDANNVLLAAVSPSGQLFSRAPQSAAVAAVLQAAVGQSADVLQVKDSTGALLARLAADGTFYRGNDAAVLSAAAQTLSNKTLASPAFTGTPTGLTAAAVGLGNANNTSDANKPISGPQQAGFDADRARLTALEADTGWVGLAAASGWAIDPTGNIRYKKTGAGVTVALYAVNPNHSLTVATTGNITDDLICTVPAGARPPYPLVGTGRIGNRGATLKLDTTGGVYLTAADATGSTYTIASGNPNPVSGYFTFVT